MEAVGMVTLGSLLLVPLDVAVGAEVGGSADDPPYPDNYLGSSD